MTRSTSRILAILAVTLAGSVAAGCGGSNNSAVKTVPSSTTAVTTGSSRTGSESGSTSLSGTGRSISTSSNVLSQQTLTQVQGALNTLNSILSQAQTDLNSSPANPAEG